MRTRPVLAIGLTFSAALATAYGCASDGRSAPGKERAAVSEAAVVAPAGHYFQVRREVGPCGPMICDGYTLADLGAGSRTERASRLDFSTSHLDDATIATTHAAPGGEIVLRGTLTPSVDEGATFHVQGALRGMPGAALESGDGYFLVEATGDPTAPGDGLVAHPFGGERSVEVSTMSVDRLAGFHADPQWLEDRIVHHGAVVAGHVDGTLAPATVLSVSQVFVPLPDRGGPCLLPAHHCAEGTTPVFTRDAHRCLIFQDCVGPRLCPDFVPRLCSDGYTMARWASADPTCWSQVCDPSFLAE